MHCGAKRRSVCVCVCVCTQWCRHRVYVLCKECTSPALHTLSPLQGGALQSRLQRRSLSRSLPLSLSPALSLSLSLPLSLLQVIGMLPGGKDGEPPFVT